MSQFSIDEATVPTSVGDEAWDDFVATIEVRNEFNADALGTRDLWGTAEEVLPHWKDSYAPKRLLIARAGGRIVGRGIYEVRLDETSTTCWFDIQVRPDSRGLGIEDALHDRLLALATADNRTSINQYVTHRETGSADRIGSPTGFGSVPADEESAMFCQANGYRLGQVERISRLALPVEARVLDRLLAEASTAAGADYRVVSWTGRTPERWVASVAELNTRMSTDAPTGEMTEEEDRWDEERVRLDDDREEDSPRWQLVVGVEHTPSGALVGFTELSVSPEADVPVGQLDTLVLREHRGHRLGMLLKVANLIELHRRAPGRPSVITYNAEENRHMLSVNEAVGFEPIGYEGGWVRTL